MRDERDQGARRSEWNAAHRERVIREVGWDEFRAQVARQVRRHRNRKLLGDRRHEEA